MPKHIFPKAFLWGAATSSYQIEGAAMEDGRGESIWDRFAHTPGKVSDGSTGDTACDHYHRWREDVALLKQLGVQAYRFSIAWPRIQPSGRGPAVQAGLDFYSRLVDELLANGIQPCPTLYHWDLPQALQDAGGWPARATAEAFVDYTEIVTRTLGDRVKLWMTHNEPWCAAFLGYQTGHHAPGIVDWPQALAASHHLMLSHGWAVPVIRQNSPGAEVGIVLNLSPGYPASPSAADADAYRWYDGYANRWFMDPLYGRRYPADMLADFSAAGHLPASGPAWLQEGDLATIAVPTDFLAINYYTRAVLRSGAIPEAQNAPRTVFQAPREEWTEMDWEIYPSGLYDLLMRVTTDYRVPKLYITENGASYSDGPGADGHVRDERRWRYIQQHLAATHRAIEHGAPLAGYFVWSLMDNFEWAFGYTQRFGITWVDFETQQRVFKDSALWYRQVVAANAIEAIE
ncbi:MAG: beta-glucosidase [Kouleothrix sp.]|nr:beta-glucosidase [Kouleothrix sp.]